MNHQPCGQSFDGLIAELKAHKPIRPFQSDEFKRHSVRISMESFRLVSDEMMKKACQDIKRQIEEAKRAAELRKRLGDDGSEW